MKNFRLHHPRRPGPNHTTATLRALLNAGLLNDVPSMALAVAEIDASGEAGRYLQSHLGVDDPYHVLRLLEAHLEREAAARYERALGYATSGPVAIIPPVPPHLFEDFGRSKRAVALRLDDHDVPPSVRHSGILSVCSSFHEALSWIELASVILVDTYRDMSSFYVRAPVMALLDERHLRADAHLLVHVRPHPDAADRLVPESLAARFELI